MAMTASKLRENLYKILDEVLATGQPIEVEAAVAALVVEVQGKR